MEFFIRWMKGDLRSEIKDSAIQGALRVICRTSDPPRGRVNNLQKHKTPQFVHRLEGVGASTPSPLPPPFLHHCFFVSLVYFDFILYFFRPSVDIAASDSSSFFCSHASQREDAHATQSSCSPISTPTGAVSGSHAQWKVIGVFGAELERTVRASPLDFKHRMPPYLVTNLPVHLLRS